MTRYSADTLLQGWKAGKPLNEAVELFDPQLDNDRLAKWESQIRSSTAIGRRNFEAIGIEAHALIDAVEQVQLRLASVT